MGGEARRLQNIAVSLAEANCLGHSFLPFHSDAPITQPFLQEPNEAAAP